MGVAAVGMAVAGTFETRTVAGELPAGTHYDLTGHLHDAGSGAATVAIALAALARCRARTAGSRVAAVMIVTALVVDLSLLGVGSEVGGLRQRILVLVGLAWQATRLLFIQSAGGLDQLPSPVGSQR